MTRMLDTVRAVEAPEGVEIGLRAAGPAPRLLAWVIDALVRGGIYTVLAIPLAFLGKGGQGLFLIVLFLMEWFYPVVFEVQRGGATPGKRRLGLAVLHRDGTPVGWTASLVRNLVRFVDFLPVAYGFGLLTMLADREFRRLGDLAAGTLVVHRDPEPVGFRVPTRPPVPPPVPLSRDEQRAVIDFAERLPTWSAQRAQELARQARPLVGAGDEVERLLGIANWLLGRR
jgi:uncharacterized RDD family membrane protein YckC